MESEITIAQLRHCGIQIPIQKSLGEFTAVSLYEVLINALKHLHLIHEENTSEKFPISLVEADTAARLRYLSILTKKLHKMGCNFIQDEHLMYPTESSTRRILMWIVTKFHGITTTQNNNDKKYKNSPIGLALFSFQSLVQNYNQYEESKNKEKGYIYPRMVVSTVRRPFYTVSISKSEEIDSNISRWQEIEKGYKSMHPFLFPTQGKKMWQPHLSEVFLYSFQESSATDRTYEDEFIHHYLKNSLMTKNYINNDKILLNIRLNSKSTKQSVLSLNSSHLRQSTFTNDAFFYNPSEDGLGVEGITTLGITSIYEHKEQNDNALQAFNEGEEEQKVIDYKASLTQNENSILSKYNEAKKELWLLRNTFSELTEKKLRFEDDLRNLSNNQEEQENEWNKSKEDAQRLEEVLNLMGNVKESGTQIQKEINELLELAENFRIAIIVKLQKVTNKRSEVIEELRAAGSYHEEQLASLRHAVKEVKKRIRAKKQDIKKWQENLPLHVEGIDRLQFLRYIKDMTSSSCGQQTQLTAVVRDTVECNKCIEALERHLRLYFARRESEVYKAATKSESSGSVLKELYRSIVGVREGYRALIGAIVQRGELLMELHRMNDRVDTLRAEVNACNSVKVEDDVKELRKRNNAFYEHLKEQQQKNRISMEVKM